MPRSHGFATSLLLGAALAAASFAQVALAVDENTRLKPSGQQPPSCVLPPVNDVPPDHLKPDAVREHLAGYSNNEGAVFSWDVSTDMAADVEMYRSTHDVRYLENLIYRADRVLAGRDDHRHVYGERKVWTQNNTDYGTGPFAFPGHTGMIVYPMAEFSRLMTATPSLQSCVMKDGRTLSGIAANYVQEAAASLAAHDAEWSREYSGYVVPADRFRTVLTSANRSWRAFANYPYNLDGAIGRALLSVYVQSPSRPLHEKIEAMALRLKSALGPPIAGAHIWAYWDNPQQLEDIEHGHLEVDFAVRAYREGIVFTETDMTELATTVTSGLFKDGTLHRLVDGRNDTAPAPSVRYAALWLPLNPFSLGGEPALSIQGRVSSLYPQHSLAYLSDAYEYVYKRAQNSAAACTADNECKSGICFAGAVCGDPLLTSSGCTRNSECLTGICRSGQCKARTQRAYGTQCSVSSECSSNSCWGAGDSGVCGNLLGTASSCNRNAECASGVCDGTPVQQCRVSQAGTYGTSCQQDRECQSNICFRLGGELPLCGNLLGIGSTCTRDKECASQHCECPSGTDCRAQQNPTDASAPFGVCKAYP